MCYLADQEIMYMNSHCLIGNSKYLKRETTELPSFIGGKENPLLWNSRQSSWREYIGIGPSGICRIDKLEAGDGRSGRHGVIRGSQGNLESLMRC